MFGANKSTVKGGSVIPSARQQIAEESKRPRFDLTRLGLVVPVGVIIGGAILGAIVTAVIAAKRTDEVALHRDQELIQQALAERATQQLREVESLAATDSATESIRRAYDSQWVERNGHWLQASFDQDVVIVVDGADRIKYVRSDSSGVGGLNMELAADLAFLRTGPSAAPTHAVVVSPAPNSARPGRSAALIQRFMERPAIVTEVAVGSQEDLAAGNAGAPIIIGIKYIDDAVLQQVGKELQLPALHELDHPAADQAQTPQTTQTRGSAQDQTPAGSTQAITVADAAGAPIARLGWTKAVEPGRQILWRVLPFITVALAGLALLMGIALFSLRRTAERIAAGEAQLRHLALHDPVCGLPNRIYFGERLESAIGEVRRGGPTAAVFYIDLDHFKDVNDTLGHHIGDDLILNVTQRLSHVMRDDDLVARLGGDEFAIITSCASDSYSLQAIAGRIIAAVCAPYAINGHNIVIGASIGIAVIDRRAKDAGDILRYADMALYRAKNEGRNRACIYDAAMDADLSQRKLLEGDLLYAIQNDGLAAAYQPIVNASGDKMVGVEALARWTHPTAGVIPPAEFIPVAEHSGLIIELGEWMLRRACLDGKNWPGLMVAVNVSPLQFRRSDFVDLVERILKETGFDPSRLELELTESTLLGNLETAELSMLRLKAVGVHFALDDFGTGYSSLLYLRRFPFDKLKIDSSFVRSIETAPDAAAIVHAVVSLGRGLGMRVTAEGVENAEQHLFLRAAGVHSMQGYRFGRAGPAPDISARLAAPDNYRVSRPDEEIALAS
jgi:diguanylate cyclase